MIRASRLLRCSAAVPKPTQLKLVIGGKLVNSLSGKTFNSIDPRTGKPICAVAEAGKADIDIAVAAAREAFDHGAWPRISARERGRIMFRFADLLEKHADELAALETLDNGKPLSMSRAADIPLVIDHFRYFAGYADKHYGRTIPVDGDLFAYTLAEPIGVIGQITPWNFPLLMMTWKVAPALAAGNTIVLKASDETPLTALRAGELALEAGIPPGVLNIVPGLGSDAGEALSRHMDVDKVSFTGSTAVGHKILRASAESNLKKVTLELGGKSAAVICDDANMDQAVAQTHQALFFNQGQVCTAASRVFVHERVYDEFVEKAVELAKNRSVGDPFTDVEQGPQVNEAQFNKILGYIESGIHDGANLAVGGARVGSEGYYIQPTIFTGVKDEHKIATDEIFGPVMGILPWKDVEEVVRRANSSPYGLAAGVWGTNIDKVNTISRNLKAGTVWVNTYHQYDAALPFGGYKMSGFGKDKGADAIEAYCNTKSVVMPMSGHHWN